MLDPFFCVLHMVLLNGPRDEKVVLVYGCGGMGLCPMAVLRVMGFKRKILGVEPSSFRVNTAR